MKRIALTGLALTAGLIFLRSAYAHGTGYREAGFKAVALEFMYSTGELMSYREARVFSPNDEKFAVQSGRTDEKGRFAFVPDTAGEWRVIVRDEEGHQCTAVLVITQDFIDGRDIAPAQASSSMPQGVELFVRAVLGVSIIFNIAMIIRWRTHNAH